MLEGAGSPSAPRGRRGRKRKKRGTPPTGYRVSEVYVERKGSRSIVGNIYKGKVDNVLPGLEAAFVDIGLEKNGFLHVDEIVLPGVDPVKRGRGNTRISDLLKNGQEIVAQVVKDPLKTKGARLTMELTIAGRYLVYSPTGEGVGVSRRLEDKERDRLRNDASRLDLNGGGAIVRTAAHGATRIDFERELRYLKKLNEVLNERIEQTPAPSLVFQEADLAIRVVRDIFSANFERAVLDDEDQYNRLVSFFSRTAPELVDRVELWDDAETSLFDAYGIEPVIDGILDRRVDLPSGGYLMIDHAEALTVIDVNTGSFTGGGRTTRLEDTITKTNLEAAEEVVRQLRLRDIGGIIVIDFIDMTKARNRSTVLKTLRNALEEDRTKTFVVEISPLGLVEMTRQNITDGVREILTKDCNHCRGSGVIKSEETTAREVDRRLRELVRSSPENTPEAYLVRLNSRVIEFFLAHGGEALRNLEEGTGKYFHFEGSEGLPLDHFAITLEGSLEEVMSRSIPFSDGDEVLVDIVEPHMYNMDDAVAKIDGYIIEVAKGGPFVGQKRLVRVDNAGRTSATATLVGVTEEDVAAAKERRSTRSSSASSKRTAGSSEKAPAKSGESAPSASTGTETSASEEKVESENSASEERAEPSNNGPDGGQDDGKEPDVLESNAERRPQGRRLSRAKTENARLESADQTE
jgi:ribonuclease G